MSDTDSRCKWIISKTKRVNFFNPDVKFFSIFSLQKNLIPSTYISQGWMNTYSWMKLIIFVISVETKFL